MSQATVLESRAHTVEAKMAAATFARAKAQGVEIRAVGGIAMKGLLPYEASSVVGQSEPSDVDIVVREDQLGRLSLGENDRAKMTFLKDEATPKGTLNIAKDYFSPFRNYELPSMKYADIFTKTVGAIRTLPGDFENPTVKEYDQTEILIAPLPLLFATHLNSLVLVDETGTGSRKRGEERMRKAFFVAALVAERAGMKALDEALALTELRLVDSVSVVEESISSVKGVVLKENERFNINDKQYSLYRQRMAEYPTNKLNGMRNELIHMARRSGIGESDRDNESVMNHIKGMLRQAAVEKQEQ